MYPQVRKGQLTELRSGALAASGAWAESSELRVSGESQVSLFVDYTEGGSGGSAEIIVEVSPVGGGDDWLSAEEALDPASASTSGSATRLTAQRLSVLYVGTQKATHVVDIGGAERVRIRAREVGVTATPGTLIVRGRAVAIGA